MPRSERIEYENAYYHVMNRGRGRQLIFHGKVYYDAFLGSIAEAHRRFGIEVHAYCLMGNHYHLLVKTPNGNISRCMRHINGVYTQRYNWLKKTDGPLFRGRFKSILVDQDDYLLTLSRYIHRNPVDTKKPLVASLDKYPWSSYRSYLNLERAPDWLYRDEIYDQLGYAQRYKGYRAFTDAGVDKEIATLYGGKNHPAIIGGDGFKRKAYAREENAEVVTRLKKRDRDKPGCEKIVDAVARRTHVKQSDIYQGMRGKRQVARWMAMRLCQTTGGMSLKQIAQLFQITHISGVSHQISKLRRLQIVEPKIDDVYQQLIQYLTP